MRNIERMLEIMVKRTSLQARSAFGSTKDNGQLTSPQMQWNRKSQHARFIASGVSFV